MPKLTKYHYFEAGDRLVAIRDIIEIVIANHPVFEFDLGLLLQIKCTGIL